MLIWKKFEFFVKFVYALIVVARNDTKVTKVREFCFKDANSAAIEKFSFD